MGGDSLVVVRGNKHFLDANYACTAHDGEKGRYALLGFRGGRVVSRDVYPSYRRVEVEDILTAADSNNIEIIMDMRSDKHLLPLRAPKDAQVADLTIYRRSKSAQEVEALDRLHENTFARLHMRKNETRGAFRGAGGGGEPECAFLRNETPSFVQYRAGLRDTLGRTSDLTRVQPKTPEWTDRLARVYKGLHSVKGEVYHGVTVEHLNKIFRGSIDPTDRLLSDVVVHTGFESQETIPGGRTLEEHDYVRVGCSIGDREGNVALVYTCGVPVYRRASKDDGETLRQLRGLLATPREPGPPGAPPPPADLPSRDEVISRYRSPDSATQYHPISKASMAMLAEESSGLPDVRARGVTEEMLSRGVRIHRPISEDTIRFLRQETHGDYRDAAPAPFERVFRGAQGNIFVKGVDGGVHFDVVTPDGVTCGHTLDTVPPSWSVVPLGDSLETEVLRTLEHHYETPYRASGHDTWTIPTTYHL